MSRNRSRHPLENIQNTGGNPETFRDDHITSLRNLLQRFTKAQLLVDVLKVCKLSGSLSEYSHARRLDKNQIIENIICMFQESECDPSDIFCSLELKYCQLHKTNRQWCAIQVQNPELFVQSNTVPEKFSKKLMKYLNQSQLHCRVKSDFYDDAMWTLIMVTKKGGKPDKLIFLTFAGIPLVVHSSLKVVYRDVVIRSVIQLFKGTGISVLPMRSKNIDTLLVYSNEHFSLKVSYEKLVEVGERSPSETEEEPLPKDVVDLDESGNVERDVYLVHTFGSCREAPIELLSYNVMSDFEDIEEENYLDSVASHVVFKGENVLEGMRKFVKMGVASHPVPEIMTHSGTQKHGNKISIKVKRLRTSES